jgi:hypothetical protein
MVNAPIPSLAILGLVTLIGIVFAYDGYGLADQLLAWVGWLVGAGGGAVAGWFGATAMSGDPNRLAIAAGGLLVGAILGRVFIPLVSWLSVVLLGAVSTGLAVLSVLAGQRILNAVSEINWNISSPEQAEAIIEHLISLPVFQDQQIIILTVLAALAGALVASRLYEFLITAAVTIIGAALLSAVFPLWQQALSGSVTLSQPQTSLDRISITVFGAVLVSGLLVQAYRYSDEAEIPVIGNEYDPLDEE